MRHQNVISHETWVSYVRCKWVMSHRYVTYEWVSYIIYKWVMSHVMGQWHNAISEYVTRVMSYTTLSASHETRAWCVLCEAHNYDRVMSCNIPHQQWVMSELCHIIYPARVMWLASLAHDVRHDMSRDMTHSWWRIMSHIYMSHICMSWASYMTHMTRSWHVR